MSVPRGARAGPPDVPAAGAGGEPLPVEAVLGPLHTALRSVGCAVLEAPPGAGKTTRVPLTLLELVDGRIVVLEPRRVAARAAAARLAAQLGEEPGGHGRVDHP